MQVIQLAGHELDDDVAIDWEADVACARDTSDVDRQVLIVERCPFNALALNAGRDDLAIQGEDINLRTDGDDIARAEHVRGAVNLHAIDAEVAVCHALASLRPGGSQANAADDVVQTAFANDQEVFTGVTLHATSLVEVPTELAFAQSVVVLDFLLFAEGLTVV